MPTEGKAIKKQEILGDKISSEIVLVCPNCEVQCFDIRMVKESDGLYTDDVCWRCGYRLPIVRIDNK